MSQSFGITKTEFLYRGQGGKGEVSMNDSRIGGSKGSTCGRPRMRDQTHPGEIAGDVR